MDLTRQLRGREVVAVLTNGSQVCIRTKDGGEIHIVWIDENTGEPVKGRPVIGSRGFRMKLEGMPEIIGKAAAGF